MLGSLDRRRDWEVVIHKAGIDFSDDTLKPSLNQDIKRLLVQTWPNNTCKWVALVAHALPHATHAHLVFYLTNAIRKRQLDVLKGPLACLLHTDVEEVIFHEFVGKEEEGNSFRNSSEYYTGYLLSDSHKNHKKRGHEIMDVFLDGKPNRNGGLRLHAGRMTPEAMVESIMRANTPELHLTTADDKLKLDQHLHLAAEVGILRRRKVIAERAKTLVKDRAFASVYDPNCTEGHPPTYLDVLMDECILGLLISRQAHFLQAQNAIQNQLSGAV